MKIHHLNCGTLRPASAALINSNGKWLARGRMVCHVLAVETRRGILLVDSGFGTADITHPVERLGRLFLTVTQPELQAAETSVAQLSALGLSPSDVLDIALTHMDLDHAGGLSDFPAATIHLSAAEHDAALHPANAAERRRYRSVQWSHNPQWAPYAPGGERWFGFENVRALPGSDDEVLFIPLTGHSRGHAGIAIRTAEGWMLHGGDSHFCHSEVLTPPHCPFGLKLFQSMVQADGKQRHANQARLVALHAAQPEVHILSAHDPDDLAALKPM